MTRSRSPRRICTTARTEFFVEQRPHQDLESGRPTGPASSRCRRHPAGRKQRPSMSSETPQRWQRPSRQQPRTGRHRNGHGRRAADCRTRASARRRRRPQLLRFIDVRRIVAAGGVEHLRQCRAAEAVLPAPRSISSRSLSPWSSTSCGVSVRASWTGQRRSRSATAAK